MRASGSSTPLFGPTMDWDSRVWGRPSTPTSVRLLPPGLAPGLEMASMSGIHDLRHAGTDLPPTQALTCGNSWTVWATPRPAPP